MQKHTKKHAHYWKPLKLARTSQAIFKMFNLAVRRTSYNINGQFAYSYCFLTLPKINCNEECINFVWCITQQRWETIKEISFRHYKLNQEISLVCSYVILPYCLVVKTMSVEVLECRWPLDNLKLSEVVLYSHVL